MEDRVRWRRSRSGSRRPVRGVRCTARGARSSANQQRRAWRWGRQGGEARAATRATRGSVGTRQGRRLGDWATNRRELLAAELPARQAVRIDADDEAQLRAGWPTFIDAFVRDVSCRHVNPARACGGLDPRRHADGRLHPSRAGTSDRDDTARQEAPMDPEASRQHRST